MVVISVHFVLYKEGKEKGREREGEGGRGREGEGEREGGREGVKLTHSFCLSTFTVYPPSLDLSRLHRVSWFWYWEPEHNSMGYGNMRTPLTGTTYHQQSPTV